jgi:uncharacterized membrane protein YecN with MAPEG domain
MMPVITAAYAAILGIIVTALAINVTVHRAKLHVLIGDGGNPQMLRMIRLHANAAEYIPLALVLMLTCELNDGSHTLLHIAGSALVAGRVIQTWGMWSTARVNFGRQAGQSLTWLATAFLAIVILVKIG